MCDVNRCGAGDYLPPIEVSDRDRRAFLAGALSLPLATVLAYPDLARAQAARLEEVEINAGAGPKARGVIAMPEKLPAPAVLLIHEWWGLNDQIKSVAAELAQQGYIAFAIDLFGEVADTPEKARELTQAVDSQTATRQLIAAAAYLAEHKDSTGKVGTMGWCFGGGWSLNTAIATPVDASVVYYGRVSRRAKALSSIKGPVLGHFGTEDRSIDEEMVGNFEREMEEAGKADLLTVHWYTADHAFANPTGSRYDEDDAALAWSRTLAFLAKNLRG